MVYAYQCKGCKLNFSIGWYHYGSGLPYHAETQLVCTACGVMHSIQHASGSTWFQRLRGNVTVDRMRVQSEPLIDPPKPVNPVDSFLPDGWTGDEPTGGVEDFSKLSCMHCDSKGTLRKDWPDKGAPCPKCGMHLPQSVSYLIT
jgi:hypothetical protein